jgi:hypothetical protein
MRRSISATAAKAASMAEVVIVSKGATASTATQAPIALRIRRSEGIGFGSPNPLDSRQVIKSAVEAQDFLYSLQLHHRRM